MPDGSVWGGVRRRFGGVPEYLRVAEPAPMALRAIWESTRSAYLDNPLPAEFKEKLLAYLAQCRGQRYLRACHCCALRELGVEVGEIAALLRRGAPTEEEVRKAAMGVGSRRARRWPARGSAREADLFTLAAALCLSGGGHGVAGQALRGYLGRSRYAELAALLAFFQMMEGWAQAYPELAAERDVRSRRLEQLGREVPELAGSAPAAGVAREAAYSGRVDTGVLMNLPVPTMVYADDGEVLRINDIWMELTGFAQREIATLSTWRRKAQPGAKARTVEDIDALFEMQQRLEEGEQPVVTRYGERLVWDFTSIPLGRLEDGRRAVLRVAEDMTQRRQLEQTLWESNRRMVGILESIADGFLSVNMDWELVYANENARRLLGWGRRELVGRNLWELLPEADALGLRARAYRAAIEQTTVRAEVEDRSRERWLEFHFYPLAEGVSVFFRDVTDRARMAEALRVANQRLEALISASPLAVMSMDRRGNVRIWNPAAERIFGWKAEEVLGKPLPTVPPEFREGFLDWHEHVIRRHQNFTAEAQRQTRDGRRLDVSLWVAPLYDGRGELDGSLALIADVGEQKRARDELHQTTQMLSAVVKASPLSIILVAMDKTVRLWNPASEQLFGWTEQEAMGKPLPIVPPERWELFLSICDEVARGREQGPLRVKCVTKDGSVRESRVSLAVIRDASGAPRNLLGILSDVNVRAVPAVEWAPR